MKINLLFFSFLIFAGCNLTSDKQIQVEDFPYTAQGEEWICSLACFHMISSYYEQGFTIEELKKEIEIVPGKGIKHGDLLDLAERKGFQASLSCMDYKVISESDILPCIAILQDNHLVVIYRITNDSIWVADPANGKVTYSKDNFKLNFKHSSCVKEGVIISLNLDK
jgi:ATP-binding cassette subfamily B protein